MPNLGGIPVGRLYAQLTLDKKQFEAGLLGAQGGFSRFASVLKASGLIAVGALAAVGGESIKSAMDFQSSMELIHTQAGATQEEVDNLTGSVLELAKGVAQSPEQLSAALFHIESAGLRGASAMDVLTTAAHGAEVGQADLESVTNGLIAAVTSGVKGVDNMTDAMGTLNAIVGSGNMRMEDLTAAMGTGILSTAKSFGVSLQSVGAALADMTRQGIPAEDAATRLRMTMSLLAAPSAKAQKVFADLGLSSTDLAEAMRGPDGILGAVQLLKQHLDASGMSATEQAAALSNAFGGGRSSSAIMALLGDLQNFGDIQQQVIDNTGAFGDAWEATQATTKHKLDALISTFQVMFIQIGQDLLPAFNGILDWVESAVPTIQAIFEGAFRAIGDVVGAVADVIGGVQDGLSGAGDTAGQFGTMLAGIAEGVQSAWDGLSTGLQGFADNVMPAVYDAIDWFNSEVLPPLMDGLDWLTTSVIPTLGQWFGWLAETVLPPLGDALSALWENILQPLGTFIMDTLVNTVFPALSDAMSWVTDNVLPPLRDAIQGVADVLSWLADNVIGPLVDFIANSFIPQLLNDLKPAFDLLKGALDLLIGAFQTVFGWLQDVANFISATFQPIIDALTGAVNDLGDAWANGKKQGDDWVQAMRDGKQPSIDLINIILGGPNAWAQFSSASLQASDDISDNTTLMGQAVHALNLAMSGDFHGIGVALTDTNGFFADMVTKVQAVIGNLVSTISDAAGKIKTWLGSIFDPMAKSINDALQIVKQTWNKFASFWNGLKIHVPSIDIPWVGKVGGYTVDLPNVPRMASGGIASRDMLALLGEYGPELARLPAGTQVYNARQTRDMLGGAGSFGSPINQNIYGVPQDEVEIQTQRALRRQALTWSLGG